jgi:hypothetical protein
MLGEHPKPQTLNPKRADGLRGAVRALADLRSCGGPNGCQKGARSRFLLRQNSKPYTLNSKPQT